MKNNNIYKLGLCTFALVFVLNSCSNKSDEAEMPIIQETSMTQVTIKTSVGDIHLELDGEKAPITVAPMSSALTFLENADRIFFVKLQNEPTDSIGSL